MKRTTKNMRGRLILGIAIGLLSSMIVIGLKFQNIQDNERGKSFLSEEKMVYPQITGREVNSQENRVPYLITNVVDQSRTVTEQIQAIRDLPNDLDGVEFSALIELLRDPPPDGIDRGLWHALQNEIMEVLRQDRFEWPHYLDEMSSLVADRYADPMIRDYASQHLILYMGDRFQDLNEGQIAKGMGSLVEVLNSERDRHEAILGTVLMGLSDLNMRRPQVLKPYFDQVEPPISDLVSGDVPTSIANQTAAVQAVAHLELTKLLPIVRSYASGETENPTIQLSSIAVLGEFRDVDDRPLLETLANNESRYQFAAKEALKKF